MLSKQLVDLLILERKIRFDDIFIKLGLFFRDNEGRVVPKSNYKYKNLLDRVDKIVYTLDFLVKNKLLTVTQNSGLTGMSLHGYMLQNALSSQQASHALYLQDIFNQSQGSYYQIELPIFQFKADGCRTPFEKQNHDNYQTALSAALISSVLTALLSAIFTKLISLP